MRRLYLEIEKLIDLLQDRNLSKVARAVGCSRATISAYKLGKFKPSQEMMEKLEKYFEGGK